jgi:hypothetical protein
MGIVHVIKSIIIIYTLFIQISGYPEAEPGSNFKSLGANNLTVYRN